MKVEIDSEVLLGILRGRMPTEAELHHKLPEVRSYFEGRRSVLIHVANCIGIVADCEVEVACRFFHVADAEGEIKAA